MYVLWFKYLFIFEQHKLDKMKKIYFVLFHLLYYSVNAQVGINTSQPDPSSILDVKSDNKGVLLPRIALSTVTQQLSSSPNAVGLLVYNIGSSELSSGFYSWNGERWIQFVDNEKLNSVSYWSKQGQTTSGGKSAKNKSKVASNGQDNTSEIEAVDVDIYQKGNVGIGYSSAYDIDFDVNTSPKKLDVGGDFRTSVYNSGGNLGSTARYYGLETNSLALPAGFQMSGNVLYNAATKSLEDYSYFNRTYDGSLLIQSQDKLYFLSRMGTSGSAGGTEGMEFKNDKHGSTTLVYKDDAPRGHLLSMNYFKVVNDENYDQQFGINFNRGKFYIGDDDENRHYEFPNVKGANGQILRMNNANQLVWESTEVIKPAQKFFYMPSIVINTRTNVQGVKRDLYKEYVAQFTNKEFIPDANGGSIGTSPSSTFVKSTGSPDAIPVIPNASDIYYYVTNFDNTALSNLSIDANGVLTYDVVGTGTDYSFINVVFVIK